MGMQELETEVKRSIDEGRFYHFFRSYVSQPEGQANSKNTVRKSRVDGLWLAVNNIISTIRYDAMTDAYGDRPDFVMHGMSVLKQSETLPINQEIAPQIAIYHQAFQKIRQYSKSLIN